MSKQKVAGTIMLNGVDGEKKFLVEKKEKTFQFVLANIEEHLTSLASILEELKSNAKIDVTSIGLIELTTINLGNDKVPLFVFEMEEELLDPNFSMESYAWEPPATLRGVLEKLDISGVPIFS